MGPNELISKVYEKYEEIKRISMGLPKESRNQRIALTKDNDGDVDGTEDSELVGLFKQTVFTLFQVW